MHAIKNKPMSTGESETVNVRRIENGYVIRSTRMTKKGYEDCEVFSPTRPKIEAETHKEPSRPKVKASSLARAAKAIKGR